MPITRTGNPTKILLGYGIFKIGDVPIGLTRGGGQFTVEREYRTIVADGDRGEVEGRIQLDSSKPKLKINALEIISENLPKLYPAIKATTADTKTIVTGTGKIEATDYQPVVSFVGETKSGKQVVIKVENAINLDNIDWTLAEKDEVVAAITYLGTYQEDSPPEYEPWNIEYVN
jgi:hypothetical protein